MNYNFEDDNFKKQYAAYMKIKKRMIRADLKLKKAKAQEIKDNMTLDQKIQFVNTPYDDMPAELKVGMVRRPQTFNFVRISKPNIGTQNETFAARLMKYMDKYKLDEEQFSRICNEFACKYDVKSENGRRPQITRVTPREIRNYINYNVCPKIDKMTVIARAMGVNIDYFAGYGPDNRRSDNPILEAKYRKKRNSLAKSFS